MSYAVRAPLKPLAGLLADATSPVSAVGALGAGVLLAGAALVVVAAPAVADSPATEEQLPG